ncbi:MAG: recombinase family protein [Proteobacteria bacterium]|nr:recombinase family protein [Pseudomonadota bacterium]
MAGWAESNCHLYLWTPNNFLPLAVQAMERWGFAHKSVLTWVKPHFGQGHYFRNGTEQVLFGTLGDLKTRAADIPTHFEAPVGAHSEKPDIFYDIVRRASYPAYGEAFRDMIKERTHGALEGRARAHRSAGGRCFGFGSEPVNPDDPASQRRYVIDEEQATVIRQIFTRYVDGASCRTIAMELNERGIASPGSSWKRRVRRCRGWVASGIHAMVRNERYVGKIIWNASEWIKDPDTGKRRRRKRPRSEWIVHQDEGLRIISDALFEKAQQRTRETSNDHVKLKSGGRPKYLLSGLLRCGECGAHYVLGGAASYVCSGYLGGDCSNSIRVRRDRVEQVILDPIREELLAPDRVERMAREMQRLSAARFSERAKNAAAVPAEIEAISDRIKRLQERLSLGDPDLEPDEIQSVIDRVEQKREDLLNEQPVAKESARIISMLPRAAEAFRRQITLGLDKDSRAAGKARVILRKLLGTINLRPGPDKSLWAEYELCPSALLKSAGIAGTEGTTGSGGRI